MLPSSYYLVRWKRNLKDDKSAVIVNWAGSGSKGSVSSYVFLAVGLGSVSVEPFVFRKPCTDDLIVSQEKSFRHAHIYLTAHELNCRMGEAIGDGFKVASKILDAFLEAHEEPVPDPVEVIRKLTEERQLSQKLTDQVVSGYLAEAEPTRLGVINAFTRAAQGLAPLQRIEMGRFAGALLQTSLPV